MKQILFSFFILSAIGLNGFSQAGTSTTSETTFISFKLKNNSLLPTTVTVISYRPDETSNGTIGFFIGSYGTKTFKFPAGIKIYLVNAKQVNTVMSGAKISGQLPFLTVKKEDADQIFNIR